MFVSGLEAATNKERVAMTIDGMQWGGRPIRQRHRCARVEVSSTTRIEGSVHPIAYRLDERFIRHLMIGALPIHTLPLSLGKLQIGDESGSKVENWRA